MLRKAILSLLFVPLCLAAQNELASDGAAGDNDLGVWVELGATKKLNKQWSVGGELEMRLADDLTQVSRWGIGASASYKPLSWMRLTAGYEWIYGYTPEKRKERYKLLDNGEEMWSGYNLTHRFWRGKHRVKAELAMQAPKLWHCIRLSARLRYQFTWRNAFDTPRSKYRYDRIADIDPETWEQIGYKYELKDDYPKTDLNHKTYSSTQYLRSRFKAEWERKRCPWSPFVSYEFYNDLTARMDLAKTRLSIGSGYKINRNHSVGLAYMFSTEYDTNTEHAHIINISYEYKF